MALQKSHSHIEIYILAQPRLPITMKHRNHRNAGSKRAPKASNVRKSVLGEIRSAIAAARAGRTGAREVAHGINTYRARLTREAMPTAVAELAKHPAYKRVVWPEPFPRNWTDFPKRGFETYLSFSKELEWGVRALILYDKEIGDFLAYKQGFDAALLHGRYNEANSLLKDIEAKYGLSLWMAESRISIIQRTSGFPHQRDFLKPITSSPNVPFLVRYILSWTSFKYEENSSFAQLTRMLDKLAGEPSGVTYVMRLLFGDYIHLTVEAAALAISYADTLPVIDRYLLIVRIAQATLAANPDNETVRDTIATSISALEESVNSSELRRLLLAAGGRIKPLPISESFSLALDAYTAGSYSDAVKFCGTELQQRPTNVAALELSQRARAASGEVPEGLEDDSPSIIGEISTCLSEVLTFGTNAIDCRQKLQKIGLVSSNSNWAPAVQMMTLLRNTRPERGVLVERAAFLALRSEYDHPMLAPALQSISAPEQYLAALEADVHLTRELFSLTYSNSSASLEQLDQLPVPAGRRTRFRAVGLVERGRTPEAVEILEQTYRDAETQWEQFHAGQPLVDALLAVGSLGQSAKVAAELFLKSPYFATVLPIADLVSTIVQAQEEGAPNGARGDLSVATVADMYSRYVASDQEVARSDAYKDFLRRNGVRTASKLAENISAYPSDEIVYFLRYVCVPEVIDQSLALGSTIAVEDERVAILLMLTELTPEHDRETQLAYLEELREIRTRQVVRDTNKRLEQSKIFVNVEGIKKRLDASLKDSWARYRILSLQTEEDDVVATVRQILGKHTGNKVITLAVGLPETERGNLFKQMVSEIRELFVESKEFGLDANLSANIRHGYVLREIRSPLLSQNLITNRPSEEQPYERNEYWDNRITSLDDHEHDLLQEVLREFSMDVDGRIDRLNSRVLRINSASHPDGMFTYAVGSPQLSYLEQKSEAAQTHNEFMQIVIDYLWAATDYNLIQVRRYLENESVQEFSIALDALESRLNDVASPWKLTALRSAITLSRPEIQAAVGRVASWFTLSTEIEYPDYAASTAFQAGIETIKSYAVNNNVIYNLRCDEDVFLRGRTLPFLGRIIFILLDNVVEHSKISSGDLSIDCVITLKDGYLSFRIASPLGNSVNIGDLENRVERVNTEYGTEKATQFISVERRSGYPKIWKILTHDLQVDHLLEVSVDRNHRQFTVEIMMASAGIVR